MWRLRNRPIRTSRCRATSKRRRYSPDPIGAEMTQETMRRTMRTMVAAAAAAGLVSLHAQAPVPQGAGPTFEVASIKRNTSGTGNMTMQMAPGGRLNFVNIPARALIIRAYQLQQFQLIGG